MASTPSKGDRLLAKVELNFFKDGTCKAIVPSLPPGPGALRKSTQYPALRKKDEEVGTYTGSSSAEGYEVDALLRWMVAIQPIFPWQKWTQTEIIKPFRLWVRKAEVTGYWDVGGVDSPLNDPNSPIKPPAPPPAADNTNLYLVLALGAVIFLKFVLPNLRR